MIDPAELYADSLLRRPLTCDETDDGFSTVRDADRNTVSVFLPLDQCLYIIRAVNNFDKMREALDPFAGLARAVDGDFSRSRLMLIEIDDLRRAAAVIEELGHDHG